MTVFERGNTLVKMKLKIKPDSNKLKYISILREHSDVNISEMKKNIENNKPVIIVDYFNTEELIKLKSIIAKLVVENAEVHVFQNDKKVHRDYINNLIDTYEQIEQERERLDDFLDDD